MGHFGDGRINELAEEIYDRCRSYEQHSKYSYLDIIRALSMCLYSYSGYGIDEQQDKEQL